MNMLMLVVLALATGMQQPADPPAGERPLQAIFMEVEGKVRWRPDDKAPWKDAAVNDLVGAGVEIRTGLKGRAALRVGKNATVLVDAGTTFQMPTIVEDGQTLRTLAAVKSGRVDFKVDKVGFANDFKVLTPQTTLAVRGTGFGVTTGPLAGVEVVGARTNAMNAIELRYVTQNIGYFLSGSATSSSARKDPVANAWLGTVGPPPVVGTIVDSAQLQQTAAQGQAGNAPTAAQFFQQIASAQTEQQFGSEVLDLLQFVERAGEAANDRANLTFSTARSAREMAGNARDAVSARNDQIDEAVRVRDLLDTAWGESTPPGSPTPGAKARLEQLRDQGSTDQATVVTRRAELETAIDEGDEQGVVAALDAIGAIDDQWHSTLSVEATNLVANLTSLNAQIQSAFELASTKDTQFNALFPPAQSEVQVAQGLAASLGQLRETVQRYQAAVVAAVRSGQASQAAIGQLLRSVEVLRDVERRVAAALQEAATANDLLNNARSLSERVLLAAAFAAHVRGNAVALEASGLKSSIDSHASAIDLARFDAFYSSAEAGLDAIEAGSALAVSESNAIIALAEDVRAPALAVKPFLETAQTAADSMNTYWTTASGEAPSPEDRMEALRAQSVTDRAQVTALRTDLQGSLDSDDQPGATLFLDDMKTTHDLWWTPESGLLSEAQGINSEMVGRMATVEQAWQAADVPYQRDVQPLLDSASARRDAAQQAADRIAAVKDRMVAYQNQFLALANAGRGGEGAAAQVQAGIDALSALQTVYQAGIQASADAEERVNTARSNGERALYAAVSNAYLRSLGQAGDSATAMQTILDNAGQIQTDYNSGQAAYDAKFPPGK